MLKSALACAAVAGVAVLVLRSRAKASWRRTKAKVSYTRKPDHGKVAGRTVDKELWGRLVTAFAERPISKAEVALLQDADADHEVSAIDSRMLCPAPTLTTHGFQLLSAPSEITSWERTPSNETLGRLEAEAVVKRLTGTQRVYAFDHTWRSSRRSNFDSSLGPGGRAANLSSAVARTHTDNTPATARLKMAELVERGVLPPEAMDVSRFRAAIINVWRAYGRCGFVKQFPLGCIKFDTVEEADCFPYTLAYEGRCGINGSIEHRASHEWHYFEAMRPEGTSPQIERAPLAHSSRHPVQTVPIPFFSAQRCSVSSTTRSPRKLAEGSSKFTTPRWS